MSETEQPIDREKLLELERVLAEGSRNLANLFLFQSKIRDIVEGRANDIKKNLSLTVLLPHTKSEIFFPEMLEAEIKSQSIDPQYLTQQNIQTLHYLTKRKILEFLNEAEAAPETTPEVKFFLNKCLEFVEKI